MDFFLGVQLHFTINRYQRFLGMAKTGNDSTIVEREALFDKIDVKQHQWKGLFAIYRQEIIQDVTLITFISRI